MLWVEIAHAINIGTANNIGKSLLGCKQRNGCKDPRTCEKGYTEGLQRRDGVKNEYHRPQEDEESNRIFQETELRGIHP